LPVNPEGILLHKLRRGGHREQRRVVMFDWSILITIASIIGTVANIYKKRWCFVIWLFTNGFWCIYDLTIGAYSQAILFAIYFGLAIHGLIKWRKDSAGDRK
jgi:nicotinamide riboside transporter PnuC